MIDEKLARLRAHRNNIHRYRRMLGTSLTELEQKFIEARLAEETDAYRRLSSVTFPIALNPSRNEATDDPLVSAWGWIGSELRPPDGGSAASQGRY